MGEHIAPSVAEWFAEHFTNKNNSSMLPLPSAINLGGLKNEEIYINGEGPFEEGLACLKMICKIYFLNSLNYMLYHDLVTL